MSLQVWLPLNGNVENKGTNSKVKYNAGTLTFLDGKLGKGLSLANTVNFSGMSKLSKFSIFFWVKVDSCSLDWADILGFESFKSDGTSAAPFRFESTVSLRACSWHNNLPYSISNGTEILIPEDQKKTWHNVGVVYDGSSIKSYANGSLISTYSGLGGSICNFHIGETNNIVGCINDLRIYDNCLSDKEIKEISKGLCLHYSMNQIDGYIGGRNIIKNSSFNNAFNNWTSDSITYTITSNSIYKNQLNISAISGSKRIYQSLSNIWKKGQVYTCSFQAKANNTGANITASRSMLDYGDKVTLTTSWVKYSTKIISTDTVDGGSLSLGFNLGSATEINITAIKLEIGDIATTYTMAPEDDNITNTTLYDTSGFGNNGTIVGSLQINGDSTSPCGSCSMKFNDNSYVKIATPIKQQYSASYSFWFNMRGATTQYSAIYCPINTPIDKGIWLSVNTENVGLWAYMSGISPTYHKVGNSIDNNSWHHAVFVWDNGTSTWYLDGNRYGDSVTWSSSYINSVDYYSLGDSYTGTSWSGTSFTGSISDFRIYATALSSNDIKQLYQAKASIDNKGNIYTNEFIEGNENNLLSIDQYPTNPNTNGNFVGTFTLVDCKDSKTGKATKMTCTTAGNGFYIYNYNVFNTSGVVLQNGKQYIWSMYVKSDNRTSVNFSVECASKQSITAFTINNNYRKLYSIFTYSNTTTYGGFTCYSNFKVNDNLYMHSFEVKEYNPNIQFKENSSINGGNFKEVNEAEQKARIYPQDIQANNIIEI